MKENLDNVLREIEIACNKSNRDLSSVKLVAVSKTKPVEMIREVNSYGVCDFGENRVLELVDKREKIPNVKWHMIGHLQSNKVRKLLEGDVELIHSVDSLKIADKINKEALRLNKVINILIEVNVSRESSKTGILEKDLDDVVKGILGLSNLNLCGLMTVAPFVENNEDTRKYFRRLRELEEEVNSKYNLNLVELSMGMSNDYNIAIEEGATIVRVGTSIFGKR